jgi:hypothetical protein
MPTINIRYVVFSSGATVPGTATSTIQVAPGSQVVLSAANNIFVPGNPPALGFGFSFWIFNGAVLATASASFTAPDDDSTYIATAWYSQTGVCPPLSPSPSKEIVTTSAFSVNDQKPISGTPIESVTPAGTWAGPPSTSVSTAVSGAAEVVITAEPLIVGFGKFISPWLQLGGDGIVNGSALTVPSGGNSSAIAFYGIPVPDPCAGLRTALEDLSPGDFNSPAAYVAAVKEATEQLRVCEQANGEQLTPVP